MKRKESELGVRAGAKSELESKLLALKEQREVLRGKGARHDDEIMKENAFLQVSSMGKAPERLYVQSRRRFFILKNVMFLLLLYRKS